MAKSFEKESCHGSMIWGIIILGIGVVLLLSNLRIIPDFEETWPLILVIIGIALLISAVVKRKKIEKNRGEGIHTP